MLELGANGDYCPKHSCASGHTKNGNNQQALGRSKGGFTCKPHAMVDALGNPVKFILTPGQASDYTQAINLTCHIENTNLLADKGYDSDRFIEHLENNNCIAVIPPRKNRIHSREYDEHLYKERHLIECFFNKIKHFRRVFSRFDKTAAVYLGFIYFVGILIWLK